MLKRAKVVRDLGGTTIDLSVGLKHRTKIPKNAVMVSRKKCYAFFQSVVVQTKQGTEIIKIPLTAKVETVRNENGTERKFLNLLGRKKIGQNVYLK